MFLAYIRLIFRGSFVEITTAILLVYKISKKPLDVFGYWYLYRSCCFHYRLVCGHQRIYSESSMTGTDNNNIAVVISTKEPLKMSLIKARNMLGSI
jgi:hypothetical protein